VQQEKNEDVAQQFFNILASVVKRADTLHGQPENNPHAAWFLADQMLRAIPDFSGAVDEYPYWITLAKKYAEYDQLPLPTRLTDLKKKLKGKPAELVRTITSLDPNALNNMFVILKHEYGDMLAVMTAQRQRLYDLPRPALKYEEMRAFNMTVKQVANCLHAIHASPSYTDPIVHVVADKMHPSWKQSFFERLTKNMEKPDPQQIITASPIYSLFDITDFIDGKLEAMRLTDFAKLAADTTSSKPGTDREPKKVDITSKAFTTPPLEPAKSSGSEFSANSAAAKALKEAKQDESSGTRTNYCHLCKISGHTIGFCRVFKAMPPKNRWRKCKELGLHYYCLAKHNSKDCPTPSDQQKCTVSPDCIHHHHPLLHTNSQSTKESAHQQSAKGEQEEKEVADADSTSNCFTGGLLPGSTLKGATLRLIRVYMRPKGSNCVPIQIVGMNDPGASMSYVDEGEMKRFGRPLKFSKGSVATLHGSKTAPQASVELELSRDGIRWRPLRDVVTFKDLRLSGPELKWSEFVKKNPEFHHVEVDDVRFEDVRLIIGAQMENVFLPLEEKGSRITKNGITAYKTEMGWTIGGAMEGLFGCLHQRAYACLPQILTELPAVEELEVPPISKVSPKGNQVQSELCINVVADKPMAKEVFEVVGSSQVGRGVFKAHKKELVYQDKSRNKQLQRDLQKISLHKRIKRLEKLHQAIKGLQNKADAEMGQIKAELVQFQLEAERAVSGQDTAKADPALGGGAKPALQQSTPTIPWESVARKPKYLVNKLGKTNEKSAKLEKKIWVSKEISATNLSAKFERSKNPISKFQKKVEGSSKSRAESKPKSIRCFFCNGARHLVAFCWRFKKLPPDDRLAFCQKKGLHFGCLARHPIGNCTVPKELQACSEDPSCQFWHHSLLHGAKPQPRSPKLPLKQESLQADGPGKEWSREKHKLAVPGPASSSRSMKPNQPKERGKLVPPESIVAAEKTGNSLQPEFVPEGGELQTKATAGNSRSHQQVQGLDSYQDKQIIHVEQGDLHYCVEPKTASTTGLASI
jgi:hypothetical protein